MKVRGPPLYSGLGDCPNNLIHSFPSPEKVPNPYIRTARQLYSPKWLEGAFSEVRVQGALGRSECLGVNLTRHVLLLLYVLSDAGDRDPEWT
jgi:hypothetical protein